MTRRLGLKTVCAGCGYNVQTYLAKVNSDNGSPFYMITPTGSDEATSSPRERLAVAGAPPAEAVSTKIQHYLHFIYVRNAPSFAIQQNLRKWARLNPRYTTILWTDLPPEEFKDRVPRLPWQIRIFNYQERLRGLAAHLGEGFLKRISEEPHPVALSDVLRLCILLEYGGGYMDVDIEPSEELSLPTDHVFPMPRDIKLLTSVRNGIENQLIFVDKNCPKVQRLLLRTLKGVDQFYKSGKTAGGELEKILASIKPELRDARARQAEILRHPHEEKHLLASQHFFQQMKQSELTGRDLTQSPLSWKLGVAQQLTGVFDTLSFTDYRSEVSEAYGGTEACRAYWAWFKRYFGRDTDYGSLNSWSHPGYGEYKRMSWAASILEKLIRGGG
ncbi:glycosyltransferase [Pyxidicoccus sp. 3LFB2]